MESIKEIIRRFKPYVREYVLYFVLATFGMIMNSVATATTAWVIDPVLNKIFIQKSEDMLYILPYAVVLIYILKSGGAYMQVYFTVFIGQDIVRRFREKMITNLLYLDIKFFNSYRTGELMSRTIGDIERIRTIVSNMLPEFITQIITIIGLLCVVFYQSPKLSVLALIVFPAAIYPLSILAKKMKKISRRSQEKNSDINSTLNEIFTNIEIIKANNAEEKEIQRFTNENNSIFKIAMKSVKTSELVTPIMETLGAIGVAIVIVIGGKSVINNEMSVGGFFSFLTALFMLYTPIKKISSLYNKMQDAIVASERTFELMDMTPNIVGGSKPFPKSVNTITFQDVCMKYDNKLILKNINFSARRGELVAFVGNSGGGKSSIVNSMIRFYDISSGNILIDDNDLYEFDLFTLRQNFGLVTQRIYIFNDTIANNVSYCGIFDEDKVVNALKMANAYEFVEKLPSGIYTKLNENGTNLSGGQRQRIAIARILYKNPQIIIFDEATSALDNASESSITQTIENIRKEKIVFVIAHRLTTIANADKIVVVNNGEVMDIGSDEELTKRCEVYKVLKGQLRNDDESEKNVNF